MILWFVAQPGLQIISSVSVIVNVMSLVLPANACLLILGSFGAILIAQWASWSPDYKMWNHSTRASGIRECFPYLLKYQDIWSISSILKELYCISDAPWDVLKVELWFIMGDLYSTREWCSMYQFKWSLCRERSRVGFRMMLRSHRCWRTGSLKVLTVCTVHYKVVWQA